MSTESIEDYLKEQLRVAYTGGMAAGMKLAKDTLIAIEDALMKNGVSSEQRDAIVGMVNGFSSVADNFIAMNERPFD